MLSSCESCCNVFVCTSYHTISPCFMARIATLLISCSSDTFPHILCNTASDTVDKSITCERVCIVSSTSTIYYLEQSIFQVPTDYVLTCERSIVLDWCDWSIMFMEVSLTTDFQYWSLINKLSCSSTRSSTSWWKKLRYIQTITQTTSKTLPSLHIDVIKTLCKTYTSEILLQNNFSSKPKSHQKVLSWFQAQQTHLWTNQETGTLQLLLEYTSHARNHT